MYLCIMYIKKIRKYLLIIIADGDAVVRSQRINWPIYVRNGKCGLHAIVAASVRT